jgi:selenocysteine lyase/cysteine desulfurase
MNEEIRQLFPVTQNYVYLNHAAVSPLPLPVYEQIEQHTRDVLRSGVVHFRQWSQAINGVRQLGAQLINAQPHEIAFVPNTSSGLAVVANGIDWRAGDNLVTADCEFPANLYPWLRLRQAYGIEVRMAREREGRLDTEEILSLIDDRTRVVALSFVQYASGFRSDLATIGRYCRERGILFVVDAIQGLGALKLDVERDCVDALSADAHKFLLGPEGVALFYLSDRVLQRVRPTVVGWLSVKDPFDFSNLNQEYAIGARRFEPGALNTAGVLGLGAAIELILRVGLEKIEGYLLELGDYLCQRLAERGYRVISSRRAGEKSAIVCCQHDRHSAEDLCRKLDQQRIITTPRLGRLRVSPHFYNVREEIDQLIEALPAS